MKSSFVCGAVVVLFLASSASAATPDPFGPRGQWTALLQQADVQKSLSLSPEQVRFAGELKPAADDNRDRIAKGLNAKQLKSLRRRSWREQGGYALFDPALAKQLKIADEQKKKLQAAAEVNKAEHLKMKDFLSRARFGSREAMEKYIAGYRDAADKRLTDVLTAAQKKTLRSIVGDA